jgi:hypothetical protein
VPGWFEFKEEHLSVYLRNAAWVLVTVVVSFWIGVLFANILPRLSIEPLKLLIDTLVAGGTIGAVIVALRQGAHGQRESRSIAYRDAAVQHLERAVHNFLSHQLANGRPTNTRRHWLNFARAIQVSRHLASKIELSEQREIWIQQEHMLRERVYDVLEPLGASYPADYYRNTPVTPSTDGLPIAEQSLVAIYGWVTWPSDLPDPLDRRTRFSEEQRDLMRTFGPRGLAEFIDILRPPGSQEIQLEHDAAENAS